MIQLLSLFIIFCQLSFAQNINLQQLLATLKLNPSLTQESIKILQNDLSPHQQKILIQKLKLAEKNNQLAETLHSSFNEIKLHYTTGSGLHIVQFKKIGLISVAVIALVAIIVLGKINLTGHPIFLPV